MSSAAELVKRQRRATTFTLAHPEYADKHVGGVNAVEVDGKARDGYTVFTGGRDGTVRSWDLSSGAPRCARTLEGHASWVNDVKRIDSAHLASASSDKSVRLWDTSRGTLRATLYGHTDYVMALARGADDSAHALASGGLNKELFLWDIERGIATNVSPSSMTLYANTYATPLSGSKDSIYALDVSADGNVLVSGGTELALRVWDARTRTKEGKLKGHTDTVRAIVVDASGRKCVTASSDRTIRVWDIGQQRCVQTFAGMHSGSIWALDVDREFSRVYSSGVDRRICVTNLTNRRSTLLCMESAAVLNIKLDDTHRSATSDGDIWTATASRSIKRWPASAPDDVFSVDGSGGDTAMPTTARHAAVMMGSVSRHPGTWFDVGSPGVMSIGTPRKFDTWGDAAAATPGSIAIGTGALSLAAKTPSSPSKIEAAASALAPLNEIVGASPVERHAVLRDKRRVMTQNSVGAISIVDVCTGKTIETFDGMKQSSESDFDALLADETINPLSATPSWFTCDSRSGSLAITLAPSSAFSAEAYASDLGIANAASDERRNLGLEVIKTLLASWVSKYAPEKTSSVSSSAFAPFPTSLEFDGDYGRVSVDVDALRGTEEEREFLPKWIVDHALGVAPPPESPKLSFELKPMAGTSTPPISNASVSAPKILGVRKIKEYVKEKLDADGKKSANIELECAGVGLDDAYTLAYINVHVWKKGAPIIVEYRDVDDDASAPRR